jgi:uncharacterized membrane protein
VARVGLAAAVGVVTSLLVMIFGPWWLAPLAAWDAMALTWLALTVPSVWPLDAEQTARRAVQEDPTRPVADVLLLGAAVASLVAVGVVLVRAGDSKGLAQALQVALGIASVVLSWGWCTRRMCSATLSSTTAARTAGSASTRTSPRPIRTSSIWPSPSG